MSHRDRFFPTRDEPEDDDEVDAGSEAMEDDRVSTACARPIVCYAMCIRLVMVSMTLLRRRMRERARI